MNSYQKLRFGKKICADGQVERFSSGNEDADGGDVENDQVGAILGYKKQADSHCGLVKDSRIKGVSHNPWHIHPPFNRYSRTRKGD